MSSLMDIGTIDFIANRHLHDLRAERDWDVVSGLGSRPSAAGFRLERPRAVLGSAAASFRRFFARSSASIS
jgi:hypothetical protein